MSTYAKITFHSGGPMLAWPVSMYIRSDEYGKLRLHWQSPRRDDDTKYSVALDVDIIAITFVNEEES